jgi:peptidoglycan/xylan/chitin deacetylase (PgdA/CDA1 family)
LEEKEMTVSISIHVDGYCGLVEGVPNLLKLFDKYNIKATFFVNMGREASFFQLLRYGKRKNINKKNKSVVSRYSKSQLLKMAFFRRGLGHKHPKILKEIRKRGHEVNPHCWSHLKWSKNFREISQISEIKKMKSAYNNIFKKNPKGFAPPTWKYNKKTIEMLKHEGFDYLSINGPVSFIYSDGAFKIIPLSFEKNIEELLNEGKSKKEILRIFKKESKKKYINWYFHSDFEGIRGIKLFEEVLKILKNKKITLYKDLL